MDSVDILVKLSSRIQALDKSMDPTTAAKLLGWITAGGLESVKDGILEFLDAAAVAPDGSMFKEPERK